MKTGLLKANFKTPLGTAEIFGTSAGISRISIHNGELDIIEAIPHDLEDAVSQLKDYFAGSLKDFDFPVTPGGTVFQKKVWKTIREIPYGSTCSYMELAKTCGDIKAIRAVAAANGKNPLWIVIPCHRVIGSNGSLTGYAGGLWRKKWLLEHENPTTQQSLF